MPAWTGERRRRSQRADEILLSSASNHPWNPAEKNPETEWEAEIDRLMLAQAATGDHRARKKSFDRVQEILHEQMPGDLSAASECAHGGFAAGSRSEGDALFSHIPSGTWKHLTVTARKMTDPLLQLRISAGYAGKPDVLRDVSLEIAEGEIVGLVGRERGRKEHHRASDPRVTWLEGRRARQGRNPVSRARSAPDRKSAICARSRGKAIGLVPQSPLAALNPHLRLSSQIEEAWRAHERGKPDWSLL